jgi:hypothetical protein
MKRIHPFSVMLLLLAGIVTGQSQSSVKFIQGEKIQNINKSRGSVTLNREGFSIRYFSKPYNAKKKKFYSAQVAVLTNPIDTSLFRVGKSMQENPYFATGTGMAPGENGFYDEIFISSEGHHYLYYASEKDKRVSLISKTKKLLELEWKIKSAYAGGDEIAFTDLQFSTLYFVIFIDSNLNNRIDSNECKIVQVQFL